jgi:hypothetical protein
VEDRADKPRSPISAVTSAVNCNAVTRGSALRKSARSIALALISDPLHCHIWLCRYTTDGIFRYRIIVTVEAQLADKSGRVPHSYSTHVDWRNYTHVIVAPVTVYRGPDSQF